MSARAIVAYEFDTCNDIWLRRRPQEGLVFNTFERLILGGFSPGEISEIQVLWGSGRCRNVCIGILESLLLAASLYGL